MNYLYIIQPEQQYLIHLLTAVLHKVQPQKPPQNMDWEKFYKLSAMHGVANMVFYGIKGLEEENKPPQDVMHNFQSAYKCAVAKEATQHIAVEQLLHDFEENYINSMPLKGYLVKYLYPSPDMRLMADVDILFKKEQTKAVNKIMLELGFSLEHKGGNHDSYFKRPFLNIEMHQRLISEDSPYSVYLKNTWDRANLKPGCKFIWQLTYEDFYIYLFIHLVKHYRSGGTGIRSIMDIWVYRRYYRDKMNWDYIQEELKKIALLEFSKNICGLGDMWFSNGQTKEVYSEMTEYIFSSGAYGTHKRSTISSMCMQTDKKGSMGKGSYWLRLLFPKPESLKYSFPILDKLPFLLPILWIIRGINCLLFERRKMLQKLKNVHSVSEEDISSMKDRYKRVGL
jgi:hypothetical protein